MITMSGNMMMAIQFVHTAQIRLDQVHIKELTLIHLISIIGLFLDKLQEDFNETKS